LIDCYTEAFITITGIAFVLDAQFHCMVLNIRYDTIRYDSWV